MTFASVFDALTDTPAEAANLRARAKLMRELQPLIRNAGWTQTEAARRCGITQPRMNDLLNGRLSKVSLDALVNVAAAAGQRVHLKLEPASLGAIGIQTGPPARRRGVHRRWPEPRSPRV